MNLEMQLKGVKTCTWIIANLAGQKLEKFEIINKSKHWTKKEDERENMFVFVTTVQYCLLTPGSVLSSAHWLPNYFVPNPFGYWFDFRV